jgi:uncharacterized protein YaaN involved in tellurite resistance
LLSEKTETNNGNDEKLDESETKVKRTKKFEKNSNRPQNNSQPYTGTGATSKMAKFSSLFKNNHEIPRVGE